MQKTDFLELLAIGLAATLISLAYGFGAPLFAVSVGQCAVVGWAAWAGQRARRRRTEKRAGTHAQSGDS